VKRKGTIIKEDERSVIERVNSGDVTAFEEMVNAYARRLYYYAWQFLGDRSTAEDIVQDLFTELWLKHKTWHPNESLQGYLLKSVKNRCLRYAQKQRPIPGSSVAGRDKFDDIISGIPDAHSAARVENVLVEKEIQEALLQLPERCGLIFRMHRLEGISQKDIARELNISVKTVSNQIQRAVSLLYDKLKHHIETG
jgi:RNA polymerase sigma-70 factor, ECF subfamily